MRDGDLETWFGSEAPIGELPLADCISKLRMLGDDADADELAASATETGADGTFSIGDDLQRLFTRFVKTRSLCGFLPAASPERIVSVTHAKADAGLIGAALKITLDGLHVARYPGGGTHTLLFDFALQGQGPPSDRQRIFHYNAKFQAQNGETVPVQNFPLFYGLVPSSEGITFGFQTVNVSSSFNDGLLDFLGGGAFKTGLRLATSAAPVLAQLSDMAVGLTRWLARQASNAKVQEFHHGLDFAESATGGRLAEGTYIVVQIPAKSFRDWTWDDWKWDGDRACLVLREDPATLLDFNHMMFGVRRMAKAKPAAAARRAP